MSTYTDLHIRTKENITILRMPGNKYDGMTPQRVIFANPENIYYGTFHGDLKALSTDFTRVMLNDCSVINGIISGTTLYSDDGQAFPVQFFIDSLSAFDTLSDFALLSTMSTISSNLSGALAQLQEFQKNAETSCNMLCASLSSLSSQVASIGQSSIDGLSTVSSYIQNELDSFQESVETSCHGLCIGLSGTQADVQDVIEQLEQLSTDVNPRLSSLADGIERNLSNINTISDEVSSINNSINDIHEDISALSDELSTISNDFLKYKEDSSLSIDHLAQRMTNGLMYKQSLVIDNDNADGTLSGLFRINDFESSYPLSAGYFYIAKIAKHEDIQKKYSYSGVEVGFGDWLIVNNGCTVGTITSNDIDVLDGQDYDNFKLSDDNEAYGSNTFNGPTTFKSNVQFNDSVEASSIAASQVSAGCISVSNWEHIYSSQQTLADALDSKISSISAEYNAISNHIHLSANGIIVGDIDCEAFTKDGMLTDVQLLDDELVFSFNSATSSDSISIALSNFIDKSQYYTSSQTSSDIQLSNAFSRMQNWVIEQNYAPLSDIHGDYIEDVNGNKINADRSCVDVIPLAETVWHIEADITTPFVSHYEGDATYDNYEWHYTDPFGNAIHVGCTWNEFHQIDGWHVYGTMSFEDTATHMVILQSVDFFASGDKFTESIVRSSTTLTRTVKTNSKLATENQLELKQDQLSEVQLSAIDSVVDERQTVVKYQDSTTSSFNIVGELDGNSIPNNGNALEVKIGSSVTSIGETAFGNCAGLTSMTIPNSVTSIGLGAFANCTSLSSMTIPNSVTSTGTRVFQGCTGLTSMTIPNSMTNINDYTFYGCSGITRVAIPDSVTHIRNRAFANCTSLSSVTIPDSVTSIGSGAFDNCNGLTRVTIPDSTTNIGSGAFSNCSSLTSVTIPDSMTSIGDYAFRSCTNLSNITIPNSVKSIGNSAFWNCSGLTSMTFNGKTLTEVQGMSNYPWRILDTSIITTWNEASQEWVSQNYRELSNLIYTKPAESPDWTDKWIILDGEYSQYRNIILTAFVDPIWTEDDDMYGWRYIAPGGMLNDTVITLLHDATNDKWSFKISNGTITPVETVSADGDSNEKRLAFEGGWMLERCAIADRLALENDISKVFIKNPDDLMLSGGAQSNLSVIKLTNEEYATILSNDEVQPNALYVISDDYIDAYGMQIKNLTEPTISSDAVTKKYVDDISSTLSSQIQTLSDDFSYEISSLEDIVVSNDACLSAAVNKKIFIDGLSVESLCAIHISQNDFYQKVALSLDTIKDNELYIMSGNYINAYGQQMKNLSAPTDLSDAATKGYVDNAGSSISGQLSGLISAMYDDLEHIATDSIISGLEQKSCISNVIYAVVGIRDTLVDLRQALSTMLGL